MGVGRRYSKGSRREGQVCARRGLKFSRVERANLPQAWDPDQKQTRPRPISLPPSGCSTRLSTLARPRLSLVRSCQRSVHFCILPSVSSLPTTPSPPTPLLFQLFSQRKTDALVLLCFPAAHYDHVQHEPVLRTQTVQSLGIADLPKVPAQRTCVASLHPPRPLLPLASPRLTLELSHARQTTRTSAKTSSLTSPGRRGRSSSCRARTRLARGPSRASRCLKSSCPSTLPSSLLSD